MSGGDVFSVWDNNVLTSPFLFLYNLIDFILFSYFLMPVIKSAIKQLRKNIKAREKNALERRKVKKSMKMLEKYLKDKKYEEAKKQVAIVASQLDRMAKKNIIHSNKAARKKSQIMKKINTLGK
jgi:small subunit ribosomal protein S20